MKPAIKLIVIVTALVLASAVLVIVFLIVPRKERAVQKVTWLVDRDYVRTWTGIINESGLAYENSILSFLPGDAVPANGSGFILTTNRKAAMAALSSQTGDEGENGIPITIYRDLAEKQDYQGAIPVAVDPWMIFYEYNNPPLARERVDVVSAGEGVLLIPGRNEDAVTAWLAQMLQTGSGVFPEDPLVWERARETIFATKRFQGGAVSYNWNDVWILFRKEKPAWLYAPLSRIRGLPRTETAGLVAQRFPDRREWKNYGIQAGIFWALPFEKGKAGPAPVPAETLIKDPGIQTKIADQLLWAPASGLGLPYNAISQTAQFAWLNSSFVWEIPPP
jgi:hypothetical protein